MLKTLTKQMLSAVVIGTTLGVGVACMQPTPSFADCDCEVADLDPLDMDFAVHAGVAGAGIGGWVQSGSSALQDDNGTENNVDDNVACVKLRASSTDNGFTYQTNPDVPGTDYSDVDSQAKLDALMKEARNGGNDYEVVVVDRLRLPPGSDGEHVYGGGNPGGPGALDELNGIATLGAWPVVIVDTPDTYTLAHEVGHVAGLGHNFLGPGWIMWDTAAPGAPGRTRIKAAERDAYEALAAQN